MDNLTLQFVQQALINEEQKRVQADNDGAASGGASAMSTQVRGDMQPNSKAVGADRSSSFRCYKCGKEGHIKRDCPNRKKKNKTHKAKSMMCEDAEDSSEKCLQDYQHFSEPQSVKLGDGRVVDALGLGNIKLRMTFKVSDVKTVTMYDVLYVPKLSENPFSVGAGTRKGNTVQFKESHCYIRGKDGSLQGMGTQRSDGLYQLDIEGSLPVCHGASSASVAASLWHQRLGHTSKLNEIKNLVNGVDFTAEKEVPFCEACVEGKLARKPHKQVGDIRSKRKLQLIHSDVCAPMQTESIGGAKYFVTFIDDYSRCCKVYFLKQKSEVFSKFKEFEKTFSNECGQKVTRLRTDNGGEYTSSEFQEYLKAQDVLGRGRSNGSLHTEQVAHICSEKGDPYQRWCGKKPDMSHMRVFGCVTEAHVPDTERRKLDKKAVKLHFMGYANNAKGYRLWDEEKRRIPIRRDVIFSESDFGWKQEVEESCSENQVTINTDERGTPADEATVNESARESGRVRKPPKRYGYDEFADMVAVDHYASNQKESMDELKVTLKERYKMDMGELSYILGISVVQDKAKNCVFLHQKHYIETKYGMNNANPIATPADANVKLKKDDGVSKPVNPSTYQSMVGSLLYAAMATRPDIAQAVSVVSKFNANPNAAHLTAVKRILRYLKGTVNLALKYEQSESGTLIGFSDADWARDQDDRRSTTGQRRRFRNSPTRQQFSQAGPKTADGGSDVEQLFVLEGEVVAKLLTSEHSFFSAPRHNRAAVFANANRQKGR
ncbi:hypothetical protein ABVT39_005028 [Epinephelus coioides]